MDGFFALTGGPGAGKTALIRQLQALGETCVAESARAILQEHPELPDQATLAALCLARDLAAFKAARGRTFFDRSLVDAWGMLRSAGVPCPDADAAVRADRYSQLAFIAPPWREIYVNDAERIQTWDEAVQTFERCGEAYEAAGYALVELPRTRVEDRGAFVMDQVSTNAFSRTKSPG